MAEGIELATAYVSIVPEGSRIAPEVKKSFGLVGKEADRAGKASGKKFTSGFGSAVKLVGAGFLGTQIVGFLKDSVNEASDLNEAGTALNQVFGKGTRVVNDFAADSAKALGLSNLAAKQAAQTFGVYGKAAGLAGNANAKFSTKLVRLASDLASFYNTSPEEAIQAIGAGLRGEAEPLRRYGVLLDDATLRQEALRQGLVKTTKEALTPQQRVLAAQAVIMRQSKVAQGDFARTSGGLANQQRILAAEVSNLKGQLGKELLPITKDVVSFLANRAVPATAEFFSEFKAGTGDAGEIRDVLEDVAKAGKSVVEFFKDLPGPVKSSALQLGLAYAAVSKLSGVIGGGAKFKAGALGLGLVADASNRTSRSMTVLESASGAALAGAGLGAFAGPAGAAIGAAVGGLAGTVFGLTKNVKTSGRVAALAKPQLESYFATFSEGARSIRDANRETVINNLQKQKALEDARGLGIAQNTLVKAQLGDAKALAAVNAAIAKGLSGEGLSKGYGQAIRLAGAIGINTEALKKDIVAWNERRLAAGRYGKVLPGIPKVVATRIDQIGLGNAEKRIVNLTHRYGLVPNQVRTILEAAGATPTEKQIQRIINKAKELGQVSTSGKTTVKPKVDAKGPAKTFQQILEATRRAAANNPPKIVPNLNANGAKAGIDVLLSDLQSRANANPIVIKSRMSGPSVPGRAAGGPVRAGQPYVVGERRPELFVPDQNGRIVSRVPAASAAQSGLLSGSQEITLNVDGIEFTALMTAVAEDVYARAS